MITLPGFLPYVFEITEIEIKFPNKEEFLPQTKGAKPSIKYVAPSSSILAQVKEDGVELVVGRQVTEHTLQNLMGFGIKHRKPLKIQKCEVMSNLRVVDRVVVLCNTILKDQDLTDEELLRSDLENTNG